MNKELLAKLSLLGELHVHSLSVMNEHTVVLMNAMNKILITDREEIQIQYNYYEKNIVEVPKYSTVYDFFERLLTRSEVVKIDITEGELILIEHWKDELKPSIDQIQKEKNYNHYLKRLKLESQKFEIEYYEDVIIIRDKAKKMLTNVLRLKEATLLV